MQLVFHAGPLDEFMLLMPLMRALPRPMTVVAPWQRASLAAHLVGASPMDLELFEFSRLHAEGGPSRVSPAVGDLFTGATRIVSFLSAEEDNWSANVRRLAPDAELILLDPRPDANHAGHFTDWHRDQLAASGVELNPVAPTPVDHPDGATVVHPGSSAIKRCWPAERYEQLIAELKQRGLTVRPVIGEVELDRWSPERIGTWTEALGAEVCRSADILLPVLREARLFIGNAAAPMHLAAQIGVPTIAILGPTDPEKLLPQGRHVRCVQPPEGPGRIEDVTLEAVLAKAVIE